MMLDYSKLWESMFDSLDSKDEALANKAMNELEKIREFLAEKVKQIQRLEYEADLIRGNICDIIRDDFAELKMLNPFYGCKTNLLHQAWRYFNYADSDSCAAYLREEGLKEIEKKSFEFVEYKMKKAFFPFDENAKLLELLYINPGDGYDFTYESLGMKISIRVPVFALASIDNYNFMLKGYVAFYEESEHNWIELASNLQYAEVAKEIESFMKKKGEMK